jgi:alanine dehydrogenase
MLVNPRYVVGVPKEIKNNEFRVAMIPEQVNKLTRAGTRVLVGKSAGLGCGYSDFEYQKAGAIVCDNVDVFHESDLIVKVKEPIKEEYSLVHAGQILFTYFHFASSRELTEAMLRSGSLCMAYETVYSTKNGARFLPLLAPMSEVAGLLSIQEGMKYLEKPFGGCGILLSGTSTTPNGVVVVIGGGVAGLAAAKQAAMLGAHVYILDKDIHKVLEIEKLFTGFSNVDVVLSNTKDVLEKHLYIADLVVGAVLVPGAAAPKLITKDMVAQMKPGSVFVDISIDQGGMTEVSKPTTHADPVYKVGNVVFYCVANMPGAVPLTSTQALTQQTFPYVEKLLRDGWKTAVRKDVGLLCGINVAFGTVTNKPLADLFGYEYHDPMHLTH